MTASTPLFAILSNHSMFEWTNWSFGLIAICYVVFSELREAKRKRQLRRISYELEPTSLHPQHVGGEHATMALPTQPDSMLNDRLRSILIQVGVEGQPFSMAIERARRFGVTGQAVEQAAQALRKSKLLRFSEPLTPDTKIRLN